MTTLRTVVLGILAGAVIGIVLLVAAVFLLSTWRGERPAGEDFSAAALESTTNPPLPEAGVRYLPVTIYQRAPTEAFALAPAVGRIVDFPSPVEKARQIVRLVLEGVPGAPGVLAIPPGVHYREVYIDDRRIAWVDLDGASLGAIGGSEDEQLVVAVLARSLVEDLDEVDRVGLLVDGKPALSLRGHIDLSRTYTGREWPLMASGAPNTETAPEAGSEAAGDSGATPGEG